MWYYRNRYRACLTGSTTRRKEIPMRLIFTLLAVLAVTPALADNAPVPHTTFLVMETGAQANAAYADAVDDYALLAEAIIANQAAQDALQTAVQTGAANLAEAANLASATYAAEVTAQEQFDLTTEAYTVTLVAYEAAIDSFSDDVVDMEPVLNRIDALEEGDTADRLAELEASLTALTLAVCHGHDYEHAHEADYIDVCSAENDDLSN